MPGYPCCCGPPGPTSCEDTSRPIAYVNKNATGAGDGTSWADAYTTIQAAVNADGLTHRIYIKGYGEAGIYSEDVTNPGIGSGAINLTGTDDTWIKSVTGTTNISYCATNITAKNPGGSATYVGFKDGSTPNPTCINCTAVDCYIGFADVTSYYCSAEDCTSVGFQTGDCTECDATDCVVGFFAAGLRDTCTTVGCTTGFSAGGGNDCSATGGTQGFYNFHCDTCTATNCTIYGFNAATSTTTATDCEAINCPTGYRTITTTDCTATGCTAYGFYFQPNSPDGCTADTCGIGFHNSNLTASNNYTDCTAVDCTSHGFSGSNYGTNIRCTNCEAIDNAGCGFFTAVLISGNTASGNCGTAGTPATYCPDCTDTCTECP